MVYVTCGLNLSKMTEIVVNALSIFRDFVLLASSDNDKHMLMRQNNVNKDPLIHASKRLIRN